MNKIFLFLWFISLLSVFKINLNNNIRIYKSYLNGFYLIKNTFNNLNLRTNNQSLEFSKKYSLFNMIKINETFYYIETRTLNLLGINKTNHISIFETNNNMNNKTDQLIWELFKIYEDHYFIRNKFNKKFVLANNNKLKFSHIYNISLLKNRIKKNIKKYNKFIFKFIKFFEKYNFNKKYLKYILNEPIDVVIKYIDLTDKKLNRTGIKQIYKDKDNEELRYSIRSILANIPWVRKIFILMPNEKVRYFKSIEEIKEKIIYIKDKDLLGYDSANNCAFTFTLFLDVFNY